MAVNEHQIVVGVFDESALADEAVESLQNAGFLSDQIYQFDPGKKPDPGRGVRGPLTELWLASKDIFIPDAPPSYDAFGEQLRKLGLSHDEIRHYQNQSEMRRTIIAVYAPGREEEAKGILFANGAHH